MKLDKYLNLLQEQFSARIALEDINGDFKDEWTDCYETRCHRTLENKYEKNICKADCQIRACMKAISRINSAKAKCNGASEPNRCASTLERGAKRYEAKIMQFKEAQKGAQERLRLFQAQSRG